MACRAGPMFYRVVPPYMFSAWQVLQNGLGVGSEATSCLWNVKVLPLLGGEHLSCLHFQGSVCFLTCENRRLIRKGMVGPQLESLVFFFVPQDGSYKVQLKTPNFISSGQALSAAGGQVAPLPGSVERVLVKEGDTVQEGDVLVVLLAMKMEVLHMALWSVYTLSRAAYRNHLLVTCQHLQLWFWSGLDLIDPILINFFVFSVQDYRAQRWCCQTRIVQCWQHSQQGGFAGGVWNSRRGGGCYESTGLMSLTQYIDACVYNGQ